MKHLKILTFTLLLISFTACTDTPPQEETVTDIQKQEEVQRDYDNTKPVITVPQDSVLNHAVVSPALKKEILELLPKKDGYIQVSWDNLADVKFVDKYHDEIDAMVPYPVFGEIMVALGGEKVEVKGFIVPTDPKGELQVLSAVPNSACFFCGGAGPETVMDLKLKKKTKYKVDALMTFRGRLKLNDHDLYFLNYILEDAVAVK